ncbi:MAG: efflux RND transporter periplasmic adaptor subunit [Solirubrobacteraceae bacterium]
MQLIVPLTESDIRNVRTGQPATVSVNALPNVELAGHVASISLLPTTSSGAVSYNVTVQLDQRASGLRTGMTASAQIVVKQVSDAINVSTSAISSRGGTTTVTVLRGGRQVVEPVTVGIAGDSTTQILSGLNSGEQVMLPTITSSSASGGAGGAGSGGRLGGGFGGGGFGLVGGGGGGFGGGGRPGGGGPGG